MLQIANLRDDLSEQLPSKKLIAIRIIAQSYAAAFPKFLPTQPRHRRVFYRFRNFHAPSVRSKFAGQNITCRDSRFRGLTRVGLPYSYLRVAIIV